MFKKPGLEVRPIKELKDPMTTSEMMINTLVKVGLSQSHNYKLSKNNLLNKFQTLYS